MKIAFVIQRYGLEVNGGSELHCRWLAERFANNYDVEVLTTCAKDYITWKNEYKAGEQKINNVLVRRFKVNKKRDINKFNQLSEKIFNGIHSIHDEIKWMKLQGPYCTKLIKYIKNNKEKYDYFIFFTYLYYTTYFGIQICPKKSFLVPTAHDEPAIYLDIFKKVFRLPKGIIYNSKEEKEFINKLFGNNKSNKIIGVGVNIPKNTNKNFREKYNIKYNFILYIGRLDKLKCGELISYFINYKERNNSNLKLVLAGKSVMIIPKYRDIIYLGFIPEEDKFAAIKESELIVIPSKYESLSIVALESWSMKKSVLVNGNCEVLKAHCLRSNGGLYYENYEEFEEGLDYLLNNKKIREKMGRNGKKYVNKNYNWNIVENKYIKLFKKCTSN